jgi:concanavalin A-like lectin/glucanase superfamily protein/Big-like domain-containing protein/flagellar hook capping protein FlgD
VLTHLPVRRSVARRFLVAAGLSMGLMAAVAGIAAPIASAAPPPGPVAEWTFDEASGTTAQDAIGNLDGTLTGGVTRITNGAKQGSGALRFDGVDDLVTIANGAALEPSSVTVLTWLRTSSANSSAVVAQKGSNGCDGGSWSLFAGTNASPASLGSMVGQFDQPGDNTSVAVGSNVTRLSDGDWHLVALTYDAAANKAHLIVDGHDEAATGGALGYGEPDGNDLTLGGSVGACSWIHSLAGDLDDTRVYNRAVSAAEILAMLPSVDTATTVNWPANPVPQNLTSQVDATVSPAPGTFSVAKLYRLDNGTPVQVAENSIDNITGTAYFNFGSGSLPEGDYEMYVRFEGSGMWNPSESAHHVVQVRRQPNPVGLSADPTTVYPGQSVTLTSGATEYTDSIALWDAVDGADPVLVETKSATWFNNKYSATFTPMPTLGTHVYTAVSAENGSYLAGTSDPKTVTSAKWPTVVGWYYDGVPQVNHPWTIHVFVYRASTFVNDATGNVSLYDGATQIGSAKPLASGEVIWDVSSFSLGSHTLHAVYEGDATHAGTTGDTTFEIFTDVVDATGVGVSLPTFYPYKDGYRDTVAIRGTRNESISVAIRIYSSTNKVVRTFSVAAGSGAYSVAWNGKTASGAALPSGKYKVVQTLTDVAHTVKAVTAYTTTSPKRLYTYSQTYTKSYTQAAKSTSTWIAWTYTLPSATVYKALVVSINGRDAHGTGGFGPQDFTYCSGAYWDPYCVTRWRTFPTTLTWKSFTANANADRSGRTVRVYAWGGSGNTVVKYSRIKITYAILK